MTRDMNIVEGRELLAKLLPAALEAAKNDKNDIKVGTLLAKNVAAHLTIENFDSLLIQHGRAGWYVNLLLRDMPPGFPCVLGTAVDRPFPNYQVALDSAPKVLVGFVKMAQLPKDSTREPIFEYYNIPFKLVPEVLRALVEQGIKEGLDSSYMFIRLRKIEAEFFQNGVSGDTFDKLSEDHRIRIITVFHMCAALGLTRYPERQ